ncbi:hypothetical protein D3C80_1072030 [compost metagenome]
MMLQGPHHAGQRRLDIQQRSGDIHQHRVIRRALALGQALQHQHLIDNDPPWLAEAQHRQRVGNLPQRREQRLQVIQALAIAAHKQVQAFLDPHQVLTQRRHHRTHGVAVGACVQTLAQGTQGQVEIGQIFSRCWRCRQQAALPQRLDPALRAQLVEHWQYHQRQVAPGTAQAVEVQR